MAALVRIAFSKAWRVKIFDIFRSCSTISTMRRPLICASRLRRVSAAGMAAFSGSDIPSASTMLAIVLAVPMVMQWPLERCISDSAAVKSAWLISPARTISDICHTPVPEPMSLPRNLPLSIGPPEMPMLGRSQLAAPMSSEGVVLSQPMSSTTPSIGLPRMLSSTSMLARLRNSMAVGRSWVSPSDITGNSSGKPPASYTPRFTNSAISRKCPLQGVSSLQVLQMPITGRPSSSSCGYPWFFSQLRCTKPSLSCRPNQAWLRRTGYFLDSMVSSWRMNGGGLGCGGTLFGTS